MSKSELYMKIARYDQLYDDRQEGDYELFVEFQKDYVEMQLKKCKDFLVKLRPLLRCLDSEQRDGGI